MKKGFILLAIMLGLLLPGILFLHSGRAAAPPQKGCSSCESFGVQKSAEKKEAPLFSLNALDGRQISLSEFKGKPVLVTFWATWCDSCKEELPVLDKLCAGKEDQLIWLLIVIDGERKRAVQKIVSQNKITLPVLLLLKEKVMDQYGVKGWVPQTFVIDREGKLLGKIVGPREWSSAEAWSCLKELLELR